jgi:hypothetical protein
MALRYPDLRLSRVEDAEDLSQLRECDVTPAPSSNATLFEMLRAISEDTGKMKIDLARLTSDVASLKSSVNVDGEKPMAVRVAVIEVEVVELKRQRTEARERQWQVRLALWTSIAFPIVVGVTLYLLLRTS